jgi:predicted lipoprotein
LVRSFDSGYHYQNRVIEARAFMIQDPYHPNQSRRLIVSAARHQSAFPIVWGFAFSVIAACVGVDSNSAGGDVSSQMHTSTSGVTQDMVVQSIAEQVLVPATQSFAELATEMRRQVGSYEQSVIQDQATQSATKLSAQSAWRRAMEQWQRLEVMQVGPAAAAITAPGGENLRDAIYSWPTTNTCAVDRAVANLSYLDPNFVATNLVYVYGLDALEYLLFHEKSEHTCPPQIKLDEAWKGLSAAEILRRRTQYASVIASEIERSAVHLAQRWSPASGNFAFALAHPGEAGSPYASTQAAIDDVFRAMFYIDLVAKDAKLGRALGISPGCAADTCVELLESPWSGIAGGSLAANLDGLRLMVSGGPDPATAIGFDDVLREMGQGAIADQLIAEIQAAEALAREFSGEGTRPTLQATLVGEPQRVEALYAAVKRTTDMLKGPFVMALRLKIPSEGAGDND